MPEFSRSSAHRPILIVDDDDAIRTTACRVLEQDAWKVITAPNGAAGLALARELEYELSLVIADVVMPTMSGREMVREMLTEHPALPVLMMSGYDAFAVTQHPDMSRLPWLEKPFTPRQLLAAVESVVR